MSISSIPDSFAGTLIEGPEIDLIEVSGLKLSEEDLDKLWELTSPLHLLRLCESVVEFEEEEIDEGPGMSDVIFRYDITSKDKFRNELIANIQEILRSIPRPKRRERNPRR